jgi:hypothetical protein
VILTALGIEAKGAVFGTARGGGASDPKTPANAALSLKLTAEPISTRQ